MNEKEFERIIKSIDKEVVPPQGLKEKMLSEIMALQNTDSYPVLSKIERLIFERPLRFACALSTAISSVIWIVMGNSYTSILPSLIGIR